MRQQSKVIFVASANSFPQYSTVLKKLGVNLQQAVESGNLHYMDIFGAPFDYNCFDNLPLSLAVPNTFSTSVPSKVKQSPFSLIENDTMTHGNLHGLAAKIEK